MSTVNRRSFLALGGASFAATTVFDRLDGLLGGVSAEAAGQAARNVTQTAIVETSVGKIRGAMAGKVNAFKGVPYGATTTAARRFLPPTKPTAWTSVRDTVDYGLRAPQTQAILVPEYALMDRREPMGEDCLCLNVWTTGLNDGGKRPVMVWLHGGGFTGGSAATDVYDGTNLAAKHNVVLVGVNHRLNIFGYLYLADLGQEKYAQAANVGMLDIVQALEWVKENIEKFGGDPGNVTIFGQSGGGSKVSTLLGMPAAKGLFHRAIAQSGSQVTSFSKSDATEGVNALLARLELKPDQLDKLQDMPMSQVLALAAGGGPAGGGGRGGRGAGGANQAPLRLGPVVDGKTLPANNFDPVATSISADVPLIIGSTETEVTWNTQTFYDPLTGTELRDRIKQGIRGADDIKADKVVAAYRRNRPKASNLDLWLIIASDLSNFRTGTDTQALRKAELGKAPVYKYYFQWYSPVREGKLRSMHTMDIPFAFDNVDVARTEIGSGPEQQKLADRMAAAWVAFAKTGNPSHPGIPKWSPFTSRERETMIFNNECKLASNPYGEERASLGLDRPPQATPSAD